jgi:hypothetical protein
MREMKRHIYYCAKLKEMKCCDGLTTQPPTRCSLSLVLVLAGLLLSPPSESWECDREKSRQRDPGQQTATCQELHPALIPASCIRATH